MRLPVIQSSFPCVKCGACCRIIHIVDKNMARADGSCKHLSDDNTCSIYESRPVFCRVDENLPEGFPLVQWHQINLEVCKQIHQHVYSKPLLITTT